MDESCSTPHSSLIAPDPPEQIDGQLDLLDQDSDREAAQAALAALSPVPAGRPPGIQKVWLKRFKQFEDSRWTSDDSTSLLVRTTPENPRFFKRLIFCTRS